MGRADPNESSRPNDQWDLARGVDWCPEEETRRKKTDRSALGSGLGTGRERGGLKINFVHYGSSSSPARNPLCRTFTSRSLHNQLPCWSSPTASTAASRTPYYKGKFAVLPFLVGSSQHMASKSVFRFVGFQPGAFHENLPVPIACTKEYIKEVWIRFRLE
jgi:hypothetical protein